MWQGFLAGSSYASISDSVVSVARAVCVQGTLLFLGLLLLLWVPLLIFSSGNPTYQVALFPVPVSLQLAQSAT